MLHSHRFSAKSFWFPIFLSVLLIMVLLLVACDDSPAQDASAKGVTPAASGKIQPTNKPGNSAKTTAAAKNPAAPKITFPPSADIVPFNWGGAGIVHDRSFNSPILGRQMSYRIYLPPSYFTDSTKRFSTLYMLHGLSGSYQEWVDYGLLPDADNMMVAGKIEPFIIVLPLGDQSYWMNHAEDGPRWGDYLLTDVIGSVDTNYRTIKDPAYRAIGGLSMGGFGALQLAFNNPDVFGIVGGHSPTLRTKEQALYFFGDDAYYATVDPISLAKTKDLSSLKIWLDVGADDTDSATRTQELHQELQSKNISHDYTVWPGGHGGEYWIAHCEDYINFYAHAFPTSGKSA